MKTFLQTMQKLAYLTNSQTDTPAKRLESIAGPSGFSATTNLPELIATIINGFLGLIGVFFFVLAVYGGFIWMKARGNEKEVDRAKEIIADAIIGIVIVFAAYAISNFVVTLVTR